jgi:uncharacterized RDD family membrane protein YckC
MGDPPPSARTGAAPGAADEGSTSRPPEGTEWDGLHAEEEGDAADAPLYASIPRRIQAVMLDSVLLVVLLIIGTSVAEMLSPGVARWINRLMILTILLYEPLLVSAWGGTLGHRMLNLRVVGGDGERLSFPLALARVLIKALLGLLSFAMMAVTRRHQALHDLMVRATVQVRDPSRARAADFVAERVPDRSVVRPHPLRRIVVTLGYLVMTYFAVGIALIVLVPEACLSDLDDCSRTGHDTMLVLSSLMLLAVVGLIVGGWRGALVGARSRPADPVDRGPEW